MVESKIGKEILILNLRLRCELLRNDEKSDEKKSEVRKSKNINMHEKNRGIEEKRIRNNMNTRKAEL